MGLARSVVFASILTLSLVACNGSLPPTAQGSNKTVTDVTAGSGFVLTLRITSNGISLSWPALPDAASYKIYRSSASFEVSDVSLAAARQLRLAPAPGPEFLALAVRNHFVDTSARSGNEYWYLVRAFDVEENLLASTDITSTTANSSTSTTRNSNGSDLQVKMKIPSSVNTSEIPVQIDIDNGTSQSLIVDLTLEIYRESYSGYSNVLDHKTFLVNLPPQTVSTQNYSYQSELCSSRDSTQISARIHYSATDNQEYLIDSGDLDWKNRNVEASASFQSLAAVAPAYATINQINGWDPIAAMFALVDPATGNQAPARGSDNHLYYYTDLSNSYGYGFSRSNADLFPLSAGYLDANGYSCYSSSFNWTLSWQGSNSVTVQQSSGNDYETPVLQMAASLSPWTGTATLSIDNKAIGVTINNAILPVVATATPASDSVSWSVNAAALLGKWSLVSLDANSDAYFLGELPAGGGSTTVTISSSLPCTATAGWINAPTDILMQSANAGSWFGEHVTGYYLGKVDDSWEPETTPSDGPVLSSAIDGILFGDPEYDWFTVAVPSGTVQVEVTNLGSQSLSVKTGLLANSTMVQNASYDGTLYYSANISPYVDSRWLYSGEKTVLTMSAASGTEWRILLGKNNYYGGYDTGSNLSLSPPGSTYGNCQQLRYRVRPL